MYKSLDPLLHSQVRLAIMSILLSVEQAEFNYLLDNIETTKGNLSFQLTKLKDGGYVDVEKTQKGNYPLTICKITRIGINAYKEYVDNITEYLDSIKNIKNKKS